MIETKRQSACTDFGVTSTDTANALTSVPCVIKANSGNLKLGTSCDESLHCELTDILHATATTRSLCYASL